MQTNTVFSDKTQFDAIPRSHMHEADTLSSKIHALLPELAVGSGENIVVWPCFKGSTVLN